MSEYVVIGPRRVCGAEPGETVVIDDQAHADYLIGANHIERKQTPTPPVEGDTESE